MSYILDALKKSERERPPGPVPDLFTVHGPQPRPPAPRRLTRALVAVTLLVVVPAIALWAWIGTGRRDKGAARPPVAASPQPGVEAQSPPVIPLPVAAPTPPAAARAAAATGRSVDERSPTPAPPARRSRAAVASTGSPLVVPAVPPAPVAPDPVPAPAVPGSPPPAPVVSEPTAMAQPPPAAGEVPSAPPVPSPVPVPAASVSEESPPADGRVFDLTELPAPIRAELPKLFISGHVWSEDPALRLLSVDDRLLHEGGEAAPGVTLREITPRGAVFVYKGWHFREAAGRP